MSSSTHGWVGTSMGGGFEIVRLLCEAGVDAGRGGGGNGAGTGAPHSATIHSGSFFSDNGANELGDLAAASFFSNMELGDNLVDSFFSDKGLKIPTGFFFSDEGLEALTSSFFSEEGLKALTASFISDKRVEGLPFRGSFFSDKGLGGDPDLAGDELET